ncbi:MAG: ATP-binding protein [Oscillospiraceae bacterium]|nr:ATP-binding protein [Oscillospiraceae bacterium]
MLIRVRAIIVILATTLFIIAFSVAAGIIFTKNSIEVSQEEDLSVVANIADHYISSELSMLKLKISGVALLLSEADESAWQSILTDASQTHREFTGIAALSVESGSIAAAGASPPLAEALDDFRVMQALLGKSTISSTIPTPSGLVFYISAPVPGAAGTVVTAAVPGMYFSDMLSGFTIWETGHIFIDDSEGNIIANIRAEWVENRTNFISIAVTDPSYEQMAEVIRLAVGGGTGVGRFSVSGVPRLCAYRPIHGSDEGWVLGVIAPLPESPFRDINRGLIAVGVVSFFLSVIAAIVASGFIKKPFKEIASLKEEAEANSKAKSDFLANMSHEIRTPMNAILGLTEIRMYDDALDPEIKETFSQIYNSGDLLLSIINDILDLSKIEAGKLELLTAQYEVASMINDIATLNVMRVGSKQIVFELDIDEKMPASLFGDELRIKQILNNVLSNAFKYTEKGMVKLSVVFETDDTQANDDMLVLRVSDTGIGMTDEQVVKIFDQYSRFNVDANRSIMGTGLGMNITLNLVNMMSGTISVKSELNMGTIITIRLPQKKAGTATLGRELAESLQKFRTSGLKQVKRAQTVFEPMPYGSVLIVDDVESNLYVAKGLMAPYELNIETVMSGEAAISRVREGRIYDIIFMDHMMPIMDGIEAVKIIREIGYTAPIVALTANAVIGQADIFMSNGFNDFISKPVDVRLLNEVLKKFVRDKHLQGGEPAVEAAEASKPPEASRSSGAIGSVSAETVAATRAAGAAAAAAIMGKRPGKVVVDQQLNDIFIRDAQRVEAVFKELLGNDGDFTDDDIHLFTINAHAVKSALSNVGESELSEVAATIEKAGRANDIGFISEHAPKFLYDLHEVIQKHMMP